MKSTELFSLLGEVDDKYFEEARLPDEEQGYEAVPERHPFRGLMSILLPIAACIAIAVAVAAGAKLINGRSEVTPPDSGSGDTLMNIVSAEGYPAIRLEDVPDLADSSAPPYSATLASVNVGEYDFCLLGEYIRVKQNDGMVVLRVGKLYAALSQNGEIVNTGEIRLQSADAGYDIWFDELGSYLEHYVMNGKDLIIFRDCDFLKTALDLSTECVFYGIVDGKAVELAGDHSAVAADGDVSYCDKLKASYYEVDPQACTLLSNGTLYTFHPENFGVKNSRNYPAYTVTPQANAYRYTELSEALANAREHEPLTDVLLGRAEYGGYTVYLVSSDMYLGEGTEYVYADSVRLLFEKDGYITSMITVDTSGYEFPSKGLTEKALSVYGLGDRMIIAAALRCHEENSTPDDTYYDAFFYTVEDDGRIQPVYGIGTTSNKAYLGSDFEMVTGRRIALSDRDIKIKEDDDGCGVHFQTDDIMSAVYLGDYPALEQCEIPVVEGCDQGDFRRFEACLPKAKLAEKQVGNYTFTLIGEHLAKAAADSELIRCITASLVITDEEGGQVSRVYYGGLTKRAEEFATAMPDIYEMKDGIVVELLELDTIRFAGLTRQNGVMFGELIGEFENGVPFIPQEASAVVDAENNSLLLDGVLKYDFHFDKMATGEPQYTFSYNTPNGEAPGTVTDNKSDEFKVTLGSGSMNGGLYHIRVEWNGDKYVLDADNVTPLIEGREDEYIVPFTLEDGKGFAVYYDLDPESMNYRGAMLYSVTDTEVIKLRYINDIGPAPESGSPSFIGTNPRPSSGNVLLSDECRVTIDFANGVYDYELLVNVSLKNCAEYDPTAAAQENVLLTEKASGNYRIALVSEHTEQTEYAGYPALHCTGSELMLTSSNGHRISAVELGELYLNADALPYCIEMFEAESGTAAVFYSNTAIWSNSPPAAHVCVVGKSGLVTVGIYSDALRELTVEGNTLVVGDTRLDLTEYFER